MSGFRNVRTLFAVAVVAGFSVCVLYAQTFGGVTGRVTDTSGAVIPGASITLTNINTNAVRNGVTTEAGAYNVSFGIAGALPVENGTSRI